jgi:hypothetical protein
MKACADELAAALATQPKDGELPELPPAAHEREVGELRAVNRRDLEMLNAWADRARQAEARAEAAEGLLREALPYIAGHAEASHLTDGFNRKPPNEHDGLAARIDAHLSGAGSK